VSLFALLELGQRVGVGLLLVSIHLEGRLLLALLLHMRLLQSLFGKTHSSLLELSLYVLAKHSRKVEKSSVPELGLVLGLEDGLKDTLSNGLAKRSAAVLDETLKCVDDHPF